MHAPPESGNNAEPSIAVALPTLPTEEKAVQPNAEIVNESNGPSSATLSVSSLPVAVADAAGLGDSEVTTSKAVSSEQTDLLSLTPATDPKITDLGLNTQNEEQLTDQPVPTTRQASPEGFRGTPLQAASSFASTVPDSEYPETSFSEYSTLVNEDTLNFIDTSTQITNAEGNEFYLYLYLDSLIFTVETQDSSITSIESRRAANRLVICYAAANRRIIINAEIVDSLKIFRTERRIEVSLTLEADGEGQPRGILVGSSATTIIPY